MFVRKADSEKLQPIQQIVNQQTCIY